jgi:hypothetical protein
LFFKWIKQHLKVKSFWGHTPNAVKTQLYCAIIAYCLVAIIGKELKIGRSTYEILQILGISLLDKTSVKELLANSDYTNIKELNYKNCHSVSFDETAVKLTNQFGMIISYDLQRKMDNKLEINR